MSTISTVYDAIQTRLAAVLTSHKRLFNPYVLDENPDTLLTIGYGLAFGQAEAGAQLVGCGVSFVQNFTVVISRRFQGQESDTSGKASVEKLLFEDLLLIIKDFYDNVPEETFKFLSHGGLEFVKAGNSSFLAIQGVFEVRYSEAI